MGVLKNIPLNNINFPSGNWCCLGRCCLRLPFWPEPNVKMKSAVFRYFVLVQYLHYCMRDYDFSIIIHFFEQWAWSKKKHTGRMAKKKTKTWGFQLANGQLKPSNLGFLFRRPFCNQPTEMEMINICFNFLLHFFCT